VLLSAVALALPAPFAAAQPAVLPLLGLVMLGMGLTLTPADFRGVLAMPRLVMTGVALQYTVMPLGAVAVSRLLALPPEQALGMVLVGAASGGTASNVITYLARGNVPLSVTMTAVSTLLAVALTPAWTLALAGRAMPVPLAGLVQTVAFVAVGPVLAGMLLRRLLGGRAARLAAAFPAISVAAICLIIAIIVGLNAARLATVGPLLALAVVLHNGLGLAAGYALARLLGARVREARTIAIEVGMQNSGLAVALALKFFTPVAALPGAVFSLWHNLSGAALAAWWSGRPPPR
jgi:BASS family bile acid:Na+ symporter